MASLFLRFTCVYNDFHRYSAYQYFERPGLPEGYEVVEQWADVSV